ncbi:MAG: efflux RND transporter periplasmic adaptor subunit [Burkholderiaceae bacterium]
MPSRKPVVLSVIVIALLAGGAWWWNHQQSARAEGGNAANATNGGAAAPQSVGVIAALRRDVPVTIEASGSVAALKTVELRAQTTSTIKEVLIKDGQTVRKGELLFRFDERGDRANLDKARAQSARDRASLADLERQLARARDLHAQKFIAQGALDTAQAAVDGARALLQSDEAAVQAAQVALSYNEIRAPLNGRAGLVNVVAGSLVQANSSALPLVTIAQIDPIAISFNVPETELAPLLAATRAAATGTAGAKAEPLEAEVVGSKGVRGKVTFVDNGVDTTTGTIHVRADFDNEKQLLWPGQFVRVRMTLRTLKDAVVVPQAAIIQRGTERSLYIVGADQTAQLKKVQLRYAFGELAVVEGIAAGDKVVLDGKQNLRPGTKVIEQAAAVNPAASAAGTQP